MLIPLLWLSMLKWHVSMLIARHERKGRVLCGAAAKLQGLKAGLALPASTMQWCLATIITSLGLAKPLLLHGSRWAGELLCVACAAMARLGELGRGGLSKIKKGLLDD